MIEILNKITSYNIIIIYKTINLWYIVTVNYSKKGV